MKKITLSLILVFLSFSSWAQIIPTGRNHTQIIDSLNENPGIKDFMFFTLISTRCTTYFPESQRFNCQEAVASMLLILDSDVIFPSSNVEAAKYMGPGEFVFIAFKKNLINLLESTQTTSFLNDLNTKLNDYLIGKESNVNLWEIALQHFRSPKVAAKVIAAFLQDTSPAKLHLAYLEKTQAGGSETFSINKELLNRTIDTINLVVDYSPENYFDLFYPKGIKKNLNRNLYHFFVPMYLSMALKESGETTEMAFAAPFMMTLTYEFITAADDYRYLFQDPATITSDWKIKDIFGGFQGAAMGVQKKNIQEFDFYKTNFAQSTVKAVKAMIAN